MVRCPRSKRATHHKCCTKSLLSHPNFSSSFFLFVSYKGEGGEEGEGKGREREGGGEGREGRGGEGERKRGEGERKRGGGEGRESRGGETDAQGNDWWLGWV